MFRRLRLGVGRDERDRSRDQRSGRPGEGDGGGHQRGKPIQYADWLRSAPTLMLCLLAPPPIIRGRCWTE